MSPRAAPPPSPTLPAVLRLEWPVAPGLLNAVAPHATRLLATISLDAPAITLDPGGLTLPARVTRDAGLLHIDARDDSGPVLAVTIDAAPDTTLATPRLLYARCWLFQRWKIPGGRPGVPRLTRD